MPAAGSILASLREDVEALDGDWDADRLHVRDFMDGIVDLGLRLNGEPGLRGSEEVRGFLSATAPAMEAHLGAFDSWLLGLESSAAELFRSDDEWAGLARRRSALEFLRDLYRDEWWIDRFDTEDLDGTLRMRCREDALLDPAQVPDGMPREHWWWFCAQAP